MTQLVGAGVDGDLIDVGKPGVPEVLEERARVPRRAAHIEVKVERIGKGRYRFVPVDTTLKNGRFDLDPDLLRNIRSIRSCALIDESSEDRAGDVEIPSPRASADPERHLISSRSRAASVSSSRNFRRPSAGCKPIFLAAARSVDTLTRKGADKSSSV